MGRPPEVGELDQLMTLQEDQGTTRNESGENVANWRTYAKVWVKDTPKVVREIFQSSQVQERVVHELWLQDGPDVTRLNTAMRLLNGTRVINLTAAVRVTERGYWWFLNGIEAP